MTARNRSTKPALIAHPAFFVHALLVFIAAAALGLSGCEQPRSPAPAITATHTTNPNAEPQPTPAARSTQFPEPPADKFGDGRLVEETWDTISIQSSTVGFTRTTITDVTVDGQKLVRTSNFLRLVMNREGHPTTQDMEFASWDTPQGEFVKFESRIKAGPGEIAAKGVVKSGQLEISQSTLGQSQSVQIPWESAWGGPFAVEQSLRRQPLKPGEKRSIRCLLAALNVPGDVQVNALDHESVDLPGGPQKLLKARCLMTAGQQQIEEIRWLNDRGDALKSLAPSLQQVSLRTTKHDALNPPAGKPFDVMAASTVPIRGNRIPSPTTKKGVYRARLKDGRITGLFADCPSQRVKPINDQTAELTVVAIRPSTSIDQAQPNRPVADDSAPNNFVQSADPLIVQMASQIAPRETDDWQVACALEKFVAGTIRNKNFSQAFATAADVARTLEGDCSEHSVLMAALCRARKIPCRVAFGLVYHAPAKGFAFHMWNEAWIQDRWIPLDPSWGLGSVAADHIKVGDSNLSGASPLADLLAVIQLFGRLELEVVEIE